MGWYPWIVFIHASTVLLFFVAHGTSMAVAFRLRQERDPDRVRALLDLSSAALGIVAIVLVVVGLLTGVLAGFLGGFWGRFWIWISLGLFVAVGLGMTPMAASRLREMRVAAGLMAPKGETAPGPADEAALQRLLAAWNPVPTAAIGLAAFVVILWLMFFKPF
jgi:hypothetical protein